MLTDAAAGGKGAGGAIYRHDDVEFNSTQFRMDGDDQVELLEQPAKPPLALQPGHRPPVTTFLAGDDLDAKGMKARSREESLESTTTGPR